jgi:hypothetical protein
VLGEPGLDSLRAVPELGQGITCSPGGDPERLGIGLDGGLLTVGACGHKSRRADA